MASISDEDLKRRLGEVGGGQLTHSTTVGKRKVPNPNYDKYDPSSTETVELDIQQWVSPNGHVIQAVQMPDGSWDVFRDEPKAPSATAQNPTTGQKPQGSTTQTEGTPLPGGGFDNERPVMVTRGPDGKVIESRELTATEAQKWREDRERSRNGGKTDAEMRAEADRARVDADRNKPKPEPDGRGGWGYWDNTKTPPVWTPITTGGPSDVPKRTPITRNGRTYIQVQGADGSIYFEDQTGARTTLPDDESNGFPGEPAGAPPLNMTPGQVADGLRQYSSYLSQQVKLWRDSGGKQGIAPEQATKLMDQRIKVAEAAGREADNLATRQQGVFNGQVTQRGQSLTETASRRGDANTAYNNNLAKFLPQMSMMGAGGGQLVANALDASLGANRAYVDQWSGFRESPEIAVPGFLQQIRDASMAGIQTAAKGGPVLVGNTGMALPAAPAAPPPSAAELEAQRQATMAQNQAAMAAATASPAAGAPAAPPPAAVNPVSGAPITVQGPPAVSPSTGEPTGLAPLPNSGQTPADGNERDDDILTVERPYEGDTVQMTRAQYNEQIRTYPHLKYQTRVVSAQPNPNSLPAAAPVNAKPPQPSGAEPTMPPGGGSIIPGAMPMQPAAGSGAGGNVQFLPRPTDAQGMIFTDDSAIARASRPTTGLDPGAAAFYGHTPDNPMMPGGVAPSFLSQARYGQPYDPRARGLALGIRPDILELALAG